MSRGVKRCTHGASPGKACRRRVRIIVNSIFGLTLGLAAAGCSLNGHALGPLAAGRSATIAIESIEGPPPAISSKLATDLTEAAAARQLTVVPRDDQANYRVRGYLSTRVERGKTLIAWVWDIYGADMRRAARITGEEPSGNAADGKTRNEWTSADDRTLRRIAQSGMDRILIFLNSSDTETPGSATSLSPSGHILGSALPPS